MEQVIQQFAERIREAAANRTSLQVRGGGSKDFYGRRIESALLDVTACRGVVEYEPEELVLTVRAGTPLREVDALLAAKGQMLGCEPPHFGPNATIGGCVAAGLSGPRRAYAGSLRDYVLGIRILDGKGDALRFGGKVIKNVAGYDVSRLMVGALGTLGIITEISLKVLPRPACEISLRLEMNQAEAIEAVNRWGGQPLPLSATCHFGNQLTVRLSGAEAGVRSAQKRLGGELIEDDAGFWSSIREQTHPVFRSGPRLWRLSVRSTAAPINLAGVQIMEWSGALRWIFTDEGAETIRTAAEQRGGHATLFRGRSDTDEVFHPLTPGLLELHRRLKQTFDPGGILNPGRMYAF